MDINTIVANAFRDELQKIAANSFTSPATATPGTVPSTPFMQVAPQAPAPRPQAQAAPVAAQAVAAQPKPSGIQPGSLNGFFNQIDQFRSQGASTPASAQSSASAHPWTAKANQFLAQRNAAQKGSAEWATAQNALNAELGSKVRHTASAPQPQQMAAAQPVAAQPKQAPVATPVTNTQEAARPREMAGAHTAYGPAQAPEAATMAAAPKSNGRFSLGLGGGSVSPAATPAVATAPAGNALQNMAAGAGQGSQANAATSAAWANKLHPGRAM